MGMNQDASYALVIEQSGDIRDPWFPAHKPLVNRLLLKYEIELQPVKLCLSLFYPHSHSYN